MNETCQSDSLMLLRQGSLTQQWWPLRSSKELHLNFQGALLLLPPRPPPPVLPSWIRLSSFEDSGAHTGLELGSVGAGHSVQLSQCLGVWMALP